MTTTEPITAEHILKTLCRYFNTTPDVFYAEGKGNERIWFIKQAYTYCLWLYTPLRQPQIAKLIRRDRSLVTISVKRIRQRCQVDEEFRNRIIELENLFE